MRMLMKKTNTEAKIRKKLKMQYVDRELQSHKEASTINIYFNICVTSTNKLLGWQRKSYSSLPEKVNFMPFTLAMVKEKIRSQT